MRLGKVSTLTSDGRFLLRRGTLPEVSPDTLVDIVTSACDMALVVSAEHVVESVLVNPQMGQGAKVGHWPGQPLRELLTPESWLKFVGRLASGEMDTHRPMMVELTHRDAANFQFPIRYAVSRTSDDGALLMVGRDLRPIAELQQQLVQAQLALERDYEAQRELETRYRVLMEVNPAPLVLVSMSTGKIIDLNAAAIELIGAQRADLIGAQLTQEFESRRRGDLLESLGKVSGAESEGAVDLTARRSKLPLQVTATMFRAAGDRLLLCRLGQSDAVKAQGGDVQDLSDKLFQKGIDAMVFLDGGGMIRAANESFLNLIDSNSLAMVQGRSFADFLSRGTIDLRVLMDNAKRLGHLRHYATRLNTDYQGQIAVEVSATWFADRLSPTLALVIRDSTVAENSRFPTGIPGNEGLRSVMQLVGYSTLKDIVAETTEIIEKMCIETALELTRNNRVAAAELLSLSRQSLYVKLRKFGLLSKETD
jgi:transcriptional regulator PpsR